MAVGVGSTEVEEKMVQAKEVRGKKEEDKCMQTDIGWQVTGNRRRVRKVVQRKPVHVIGDNMMKDAKRRVQYKNDVDSDWCQDS